MRLLISTFILVLTLSTWAQSKDVLAKAAFLKAQEYYGNALYADAVKKLEEVVTLLGGSNPRVDHLKTHCYFELKDAQKASKAMESYFSKASETDINYMDMLSILPDVRDMKAIEDEKLAIEMKGYDLSLRPSLGKIVNYEGSMNLTEIQVIKIADDVLELKFILKENILKVLSGGTFYCRLDRRGKVLELSGLNELQQHAENQLKNLEQEEITKINNEQGTVKLNKKEQEAADRQSEIIRKTKNEFRTTYENELRENDALSKEQVDKILKDFDESQSLTPTQQMLKSQKAFISQITNPDWMKAAIVKPYIIELNKTNFKKGDTWTELGMSPQLSTSYALDQIVNNVAYVNYINKIGDIQQFGDVKIDCSTGFILERTINGFSQIKQIGYIPNANVTNPNLTNQINEEMIKSLKAAGMDDVKIKAMMEIRQKNINNQRGN